MDGYTRVSRVNGRKGESFISPTVQREQIEGWAKLRGVEIAGWYQDLDQSGGKLERPGLNAILARLEAKETDGIIVAKLDRLSRLGVGDALKLVERITNAGGSISAVDLGLDPTTPFGEFGMTIMLAMARMERRRLSDSWATARAKAVERGVVTTKTPYGYRRDADSILQPHPQESMHVRRAYELAAAQGMAAAHNYLKVNVPHRFWTTAMARRLLSKRTYLGESRHGENVNTKAHEPLVSLQLWEAAQHEPRVYVRQTEAYPLSGFITCATCGTWMVAGKKTSSGKQTYRCAAGQTLYRGARCPKPASVITTQLEAHLRERLRAGRLSVSVADGDDGLALAERAVLEAEAELEAFAADLTIRRALGSRYHDHLSSRITEVESARATYRELAHKAQARERTASMDVLDNDDPRLFAELLRGMEVTITVAPGRMPIADKVRIFPFDGELPPGIEDRSHP